MHTNLTLLFNDIAIQVDANYMYVPRSLMCSKHVAGCGAAGSSCGCKHALARRREVGVVSQKLGPRTAFLAWDILLVCICNIGENGHKREGDRLDYT